MLLRSSGRHDEAKAFAAGYKQAKLKGACGALIDVMKTKSQTQYVSPYALANTYALMGDRDGTFEWLEKAYQEHSGRVSTLRWTIFFNLFTLIPGTLISSGAWAFRPNPFRLLAAPFVTDWQHEAFSISTTFSLRMKPFWFMMPHPPQTSQIVVVRPHLAS